MTADEAERRSAWHEINSIIDEGQRTAEIQRNLPILQVLNAIAAHVARVDTQLYDHVITLRDVVSAWQREQDDEKVSQGTDLLTLVRVIEVSMRRLEDVERLAHEQSRAIKAFEEYRRDVIGPLQIAVRVLTKEVAELRTKGGAP